jgi:hypothetical protein
MRVENQTKTRTAFLVGVSAHKLESSQTRERFCLVFYPRFSVLLNVIKDSSFLVSRIFLDF